jgi:hypothetical protein
MSRADAVTFIKTAMTDPELRKKIDRSATSEERTAVLKEYELKFTEFEFQDGFNNLLTRCQEEGDADRLREFRMWWDLTRSA